MKLPLFPDVKKITIFSVLINLYYTINIRCKSLGTHGLQFLAIINKKVISFIKLSAATYNRDAYLGPLAIGFRSRNFLFSGCRWNAHLRFRSQPLRRCPGRRSSVGGMAHAATIDPVILVGLLLSIISFVGWLIEWIAMRRVPHPVAARRGSRARGHITRNKRLARGGRGRRRRRSCGLRRRRLLSYGCRVYTADLIDSIMK